MNEKWNEKEFKKHLNKSFNIQDKEGNAIIAELVEVSDQSNEQIESFSIMFKGPQTPALPHDVLTVKSDDIGEHELLIGPVATSKQDGVYYEAVFNKLKE
jgi:hypothetical protein